MSQLYVNIWAKKLRFTELSFLFALSISAPAIAQIIPDSTLPTNSLVTNQGNTSLIEGGTKKGVNLFHSFEQLSVPTGSTAYFNNTLDIQNIFSRVTGKDISNIDGALRANGTANLFLLNPNGIIFGPNASLNIGGSFISSTASSINFADGSQFIATSPQTAPLLTVSVPVGLQFGGSAAEIRVQGKGYDLIASGRGFPPIIRGNSSTGLQVHQGKTLALIGGDVALEGGVLTAEGGKIELGSVGSGLVSLNLTSSGRIFGYEGVSSFRNIQLSQQSLIDASGFGSGAIHFQGARVKLTDGSLVWTQNRGSQPGGDLTVNSSESLEIIGTSPDRKILSGFLTEAVGNGKGGAIEISTPNLTLREGASIGTVTFSTAPGGNVAVNASNSIEISRFSPLASTGGGGIGAVTFGSGPGGNVTLATDILTVANRGNLNTVTFGSGSGGNLSLRIGSLTVIGGGTVGTFTFGSGKGGNALVNANNSVELIGKSPTFVPSVLNAATFSSGNAGELTVNTQKLVVRDGGRIDTATVSSGDAGSLTINASDSVEVTGTGPESVNPSLIDSSASVVENSLQQTFNLPSVPTGSSGSVIINTRELNVNNGELVSVRNDGQKNAGNIQINANSINLDNRGGITASTKGGEGGSIFIQAQNLQLRHDSLITASAGGIGKGGNININTDTLAALENSHISANAQGGTGGRVTINTQGIFLSPDSEITATSEAGPQFNGRVQINTLDVDPSRGLVTLPTQPVNVTELIAQGCSGSGGNVARRSSEFIITGRRGLPPYQPGEPLRAEALLFNEDSLEAGGDKRSASVTSMPATSSTPTPLVEATGWMYNELGEVVLTADPPNATPYSTGSTSRATCYAP